MSENDVRVLSLMVSCVAAVITLLAAYRGRIAAKQTRELQILGLVRQYHTDLRTWADEAVNVLSRTALLCELDPARMVEGMFFNLRHDLRSQLSALIDRGRWFLPNKTPEAYGPAKPMAFRGFRDAALDALVHSLRILEALNYQEKASNAEKREVIIESKRTFVNEIQETLDPRSWVSDIASLRASVMKAS